MKFYGNKGPVTLDVLHKKVRANYGLQKKFTGRRKKFMGYRKKFMGHRTKCERCSFEMERISAILLTCWGQLTLIPILVNTFAVPAGLRAFSLTDTQRSLPIMGKMAWRIVDTPMRSHK